MLILIIKVINVWRNNYDIIIKVINVWRNNYDIDDCYVSDKFMISYDEIN